MINQSNDWPSTMVTNVINCHCQQSLASKSWENSGESTMHKTAHRSAQNCSEMEVDGDFWGNPWKNLNALLMYRDICAISVSIYRSCIHGVVANHIPPPRREIRDNFPQAPSDSWQHGAIWGKILCLAAICAAGSGRFVTRWGGGLTKEFHQLGLYFN